MEAINWTVVIAAASLEIVLITTAVGVVWKLSRSEIALRTENDAKIAAVQAEADRKVTAALSEATKTIATLAEKLYEVEIWSRDEFVRKGSFELVVARLERSMEAIGAKVEAAVDKMASKFDSLQQKSHQTHHRD